MKGTLKGREANGSKDSHILSRWEWELVTNININRMLSLYYVACKQQNSGLVIAKTFRNYQLSMKLNVIEEFETKERIYYSNSNRIAWM